MNIKSALVVFCLSILGSILGEGKVPLVLYLPNQIISDCCHSMTLEVNPNSSVKLTSFEQDFLGQYDCQEEKFNNRHLYSHQDYTDMHLFFFNNKIQNESGRWALGTSNLDAVVNIYKDGPFKTDLKAKSAKSAKTAKDSSLNIYHLKSSSTRLTNSICPSSAKGLWKGNVSVTSNLEPGIASITITSITTTKTSSTELATSTMPTSKTSSKLSST